MQTLQQDRWTPVIVFLLQVFEHKKLLGLEVMSICAATDRIVTGHDDGSICLWKPLTGGLLYSKQHHNSNVTSIVAVQYEGQPGFLLTASMDGRLCLLDIRGNTLGPGVEVGS